MEYHKQVRNNSTIKLREILKELPSFCSDYFRGIGDSKAPRTKLGYATDLRLFFNFLSAETRDFAGKALLDFTLSDLDALTVVHLEEFMEYLSYYEKNQSGTKREFSNEERGKARKLSALRSMFSYFYKREKLSRNITELLDHPKIHEKNITRLEPQEVALLLDEIEAGEKLTETQKRYHGYTKTRDLAIVTLLLGTGMRVSECVGIDIHHLDLDTNTVKITRKGGNESLLHYGDEVAQALLDYLDERELIEPVIGHEDALFLSMQRTRLTDRSIQNLVKKYAKLINAMKNISPHKLRSTFGTTLYRESRDIFLVADVLGHKDVSTTRKHYAEMDDDRRKEAVKFIHLRKD